MQCLHFVKVKPIEEGDYLVLRPYHKWLRENKIMKFRGGEWATSSPFSVIFRFANIEDAMAFKLRWYE